MAERWEGLGRMLGLRESQHGEDKWTRRVARQVNMDRGKMCDVGVTTGEREITEVSVEVLVSAGVLVVVNEAGVVWVSVAREFDTREMMDQVAKLTREFKC